MSQPGKKTIVGILGGIGSGKSAVAAEFAKLGCKVIDADRIAHQLLDEPAVKDIIVTSFGSSVLDSAGKLDRGELGEVVFADKEKLSVLNEIIHPAVLRKAEELIELYNHQSEVKAIVLDMPLLVEVGWDKRCDRLIFVDCEEKLRAERGKKTWIFKENEDKIKIRENFQISLDNKAGLSDNVIDNNSGFSALARQVADIFSNIVDN